MSDSPRWHLNGLPGTTGIVEVMLYADHVAAVAAAEQRVRDEFMDSTPGLTAYRKQQYAAGVKAAREAVAALPWLHRWADGVVFRDIDRDAALAAIDALEKP